MPLTPATIKRAIDASGDDLRTFQDGAVEVPGTAIVGDAGEHIGIAGAPLQVAPPSLSKSSTGGALESSHNAKNVAGTFYRATGTVDIAGAGGPGFAYLMVFDLAAPPAGGETPVLRRGFIYGDGTGTGSPASVELVVPEGLAMANGIQVAFSNDLDTLNLAGANFAFDVFFT